jgi:hypothetical protein
MKAAVKFHAGVLIIVKGADRHSIATHTNTVQLCRLSGSYILFYCFKYIHCIILSGNKKGTRHFHSENGKCLLEFHILFFLFIVIIMSSVLPKRR